MLDRYGATAIAVRPDRHWLQLIEGQVLDPAAPGCAAAAASAANAPAAAGAAVSG